MSEGGGLLSAAAWQESRQSPVARGTIYSYTRLREPPAGFEAGAPCYLALIALEDGRLITAQLTDVDGEVAIGDDVEMVTRKLTTDGERGMIVYGYKFRPAMQ